MNNQEIKQKLRESKIHLRLDSSILPDTNCILKYLLKGLIGLTGQVQDHALVFGSATHVFIENFLRGDEEVIAKFKAIKYLRDTLSETNIYNAYQNDSYLSRVCLSVEEAFTTKEPWKSEMELVQKPNGTGPMVETNFSIPLFEDENVRIDLTGTIDTIYKIVGGCYIVNDWKTSQARDRNLYFHPYELSHQLLTYYFALKWFADSEKLATENPGASDLYKSIMYGSYGLGFTITGIFMSGKDSIPEVIRSKIFFPTEQQIKCYEWWLLEKCSKISRTIGLLKSDDRLSLLHLREGLVNGACRGDYGKICPFFNACCNDKIEIFENVLNNSFVEKEYNPLMFRK